MARDVLLTVALPRDSSYPGLRIHLAQMQMQMPDGRAELRIGATPAWLGSQAPAVCPDSIHLERLVLLEYRLLHLKFGPQPLKFDAESLKWTAGATVARSTPDRKVIRSNRVWFKPWRRAQHVVASFWVF